MENYWGYKHEWNAFKNKHKVRCDQTSVTAVLIFDLFLKTWWRLTNSNHIDSYLSSHWGPSLTELVLFLPSDWCIILSKWLQKVWVIVSHNKTMFVLLLLKMKALPGSIVPTWYCNFICYVTSGTVIVNKMWTNLKRSDWCFSSGWIKKKFIGRL